MIMVPEFSRPIDRRKLDRSIQKLVANDGERAALANRFALVSIQKLEAELELAVEGEVIMASGHLDAEITQSCSVSGEDVPVTISEDVVFRFIPHIEAAPDEEIELDADELDVIEYDGHVFDLGEAVAQSLALNIDPFLEGPNADSARLKAGIKSDDAPSGPLAEALAALKKE